MVRLVLVHVASLLFLLQTSKQTDYYSMNFRDVAQMRFNKYVENLRTEIYDLQQTMNKSVQFIRDHDSKIKILKDEIRNSVPNGSENVDQYISCRTNYWTGDAAANALYLIQNIKNHYKKENTFAYLISAELIACFKEKDEHYEKLKTDHSEAFCNGLIPYRTKGIVEMDNLFFEKSKAVAYMNSKFFQYRLLLKSLKVVIMQSQ
ncbi:hypothetical protein MS3_00000198 [Schistosoma haematobium]|uniref:Uncharacterized protein n=1 Tax=Schistosoma haematobium TaxID=6185 RepID=A0A922IPB2_SCHHA|nr:hypothetical protein MS3_00000198 [Schistosoma haematobium]KAH9584379.1 hypothetical protein MS3_00000198 [Schistosoma haematobium]